MDALQQSTYRAQNYRLLSLLLLEGPVDRLASRMLANPALAEVFKSDSPEAVRVAEHERVLGDVPVRARAFLPPEERERGPGSEQLRAVIAGDAPDDGAGGASDHLGAVLRVLGALAAAEARALHDTEETAFTTSRWMQRSVLDTQVLSWLPPVVTALRRHPDAGFQTTVVEMALELGIAHWAALAGGAAPGLARVEPLTRPQSIVAHVCTPHRAGWFLRTSEVRVVGAALGFDVGGGTTGEVLGRLVAAATSAGRLDQLLRSIAAFGVAWRRSYRELAAVGAPVQAWDRRVRHTVALLSPGHDR